MRLAEGWRDYSLIDATDRQRLERWGDVTLVRPDPQVIWKSARKSPLWAQADAVYHRSSSGGGEWEYRRSIPRGWRIGWDDQFQLNVTPTNFKHTGVFPEQAANWALYMKAIRQARRPVRVLNLFGYTGAATVACLLAGASTCHVDASKGMVTQAKENIELNGLGDREVRYIVDDCQKFVAREIRRGNRYDALIMDPPSYGRGPSGEMWKLEDNLYDFVLSCRGVLADDPLFVALNSYTAGLAPAVMQYVVASVLGDLPGRVQSDELGLRVESSGLALPAGATAVYLSNEVSI